MSPEEGDRDRKVFCPKQNAPFFYSFDFFGKKPEKREQREREAEQRRERDEARREQERERQRQRRERMQDLHKNYNNCHYQATKLFHFQMAYIDDIFPNLMTMKKLLILDFFYAPALCNENLDNTIVKRPFSF